MKTQTLTFALVSLLLTSSAAFASPRQGASSSSGTRLTPEQALNMYRMADLHFSPDGLQLAFTVVQPPKGAENPRHIWVLDVATHAARQYTYSAKSDDSPRWSPDGKFLAFFSQRDDSRQIFLLPTAGGEAYPITEGKLGIRSFEWSPDGKQIAFVASDAPTAEEEKKEKDKDDAIVVDQNHKNSRIWLLDVAAKKARALTDEKWDIHEMQWAPQGDRFVVTATDHPESDDDTDRIFSVDASSGAPTLLYAPKGPFGGIRVSRDGTQVAYVGSRVDGPEPCDIYVRSLSAPTDQPSRNLTAKSLDRGMNGLDWRPDGSIMAVAENGFHSVLYSIASDGAAKAIDGISPNPRDVVVSSTGEIAFVGGTSTMAPEVYLASAGGKAERVTNINASWDKLALAKPEFFHYRSFDGLEIEGSLLKPLDYDGHSRVPLVILVHGGPTGAWSDSIDDWGQLLAANGFAAAYFNIRGSTGYGEKFVEMNHADWGGPISKT